MHDPAAMSTSSRKKYRGLPQEMVSKSEPCYSSPVVLCVCASLVATDAKQRGEISSELQTIVKNRIALAVYNSIINRRAIQIRWLPCDKPPAKPSPALC